MSTEVPSSVRNTGLYSKVDTNNEIQLLHLQPSVNSKAPIQCSLKTVLLSSNPVYEALSYAWVDKARDKPLRLEGQEFNVTLSAWSALKALRCNDRLRILWIDAICINQDDLEKRAAQVKLMGTIYRQASSVRVWLGPLGSDDGIDGDNYGIENLQAICTLGAKRTLSPPIGN
jgi:hypothetical protein